MKKLVINKLVFFLISLLSETLAGPQQQQIYQWYKSLNTGSLNNCDKRSKFVFNEEDVLTENVDCKKDKGQNVFSNYYFVDFDYSGDGSFETIVKGKGHLFFYHGDEEHSSKSPMRGTIDKSKEAKSICMRGRTFLGKKLLQVSGTFMKGRLTGEARLKTLDDKKFNVNFVKGVPHGRIRVLNIVEHQEEKIPFIGTYKNGKVVGPCWKFLDNDNFLTGTCSGLENFETDSDVIVGSFSKDEVYSCKATSLNVFSKCQETSITRIEPNEDCILVVKTALRKEDATSFKLHSLTMEKSNDVKEDLLCVGTARTSDEWNDKTSDLIDYVDELKKYGPDVDPFWFADPDPSPLAKKVVKLLSNVEHMDGTTYEAILSFNGEREALEFDYVGGLDDEGQFHGFGVLKIPQTKLLCLRGNCKYSSLQEISGTFSHGFLDNEVKIVGSSYSFITHARAKSGVLHGPLVTFGVKPVFEENSNLNDLALLPLRLYQISFFGTYLNGKPSGIAYLGLIGHAFLVGEVDSKAMTKITSNKAAYVYPGFQVAIVGQYDKNILISGQAAEVRRHKCESGIRVIEFSEPSGPQLKFDPPSSESFGDLALIRDTFEEKFIKLGSSGIAEAGEGVFAAEDIPRVGSLIAIYGGRMYNNPESRKNRELNCDTNKNLSKEEKKKCFRFRKLIYNARDFIDIPDEFSSDEFYRATYGHKVNHSNQPNAIYYLLDHPRFGLLPSVISTKPIKAGEEIFADYNYDKKSLQTKEGLDWYDNLKIEL